MPSNVKETFIYLILRRPFRQCQKVEPVDIVPVLL